MSDTKLPDLSHLRGPELAQHVLDTIRREVAVASERSGIILTDSTRVDAWNQGTWGEVLLDNKILDGAKNYDLLAGEDPGYGQIGTHPFRHRLAVPAQLILGQIESDSQCGTAMCFAGHVAMMTGAQAVLPAWASERDPNTGKFKALGQEVTWDGVKTPDGFYETVSDYAAGMLGIDASYDANVLFDASNTVEDLEHMVEILVRGGSLGSLEKCSACDEWPWACGEDTCDECDHHEGDCICEICSVCGENEDAGDCECEDCTDCGGRYDLGDMHPSGRCDECEEIEQQNLADDDED